jgi:hypothetical protein
MQKYKAIFLIISSDDLEVYQHFKKISRQYYTLFEQDIKFFYLEMCENLEEDVKEVGDHLYVKGIENHIPGVYLKTVKAIEYVNKYYEYDFIFRQNLSSFYNVPNIIKFIETLPKSNFLGGHYLGHDGGFITGTGILMSRDIANILTRNVYDSNIPDDVLISQIFKKENVPFVCTNNYYHWPCVEIDHYDKERVEVSDRVLYCRIKSIGDRNIDLLYHKYLMKETYGIII